MITNRQLAKIEDSTLQALSACSVNAAQSFAVATSQTVDVAAAMAVADAINNMRALFDRPEVRQRIESLQDTPLGFRTDRDPKMTNRKSGAPNQPYDWVIVREASIEAMLRGLQLVGNQFNIIAGRFYGTKEGFEFLIPKIKGLSDFRPNLGVPITRNGGAIVECDATWKINGREDACKASIPVKTDDYSGADQILGKAKRKFLARCYSQMVGASVPEGDADETVVEAPAPRIENVAERLTKPVEQRASPRTVKPTQSPLIPEADPYSVLQIAIERYGTFEDFKEAISADNQWGTTPPDSVKTVNDLPLELVKKYAGKAGDYAPVKDGMEYVLGERKGGVK